MEKDMSIAALLINKECPFDYQCMDMDCMVCIESQRKGVNNNEG